MCLMAFEISALRWRSALLAALALAAAGCSGIDGQRRTAQPGRQHTLIADVAIMKGEPMAVSVRYGRDDWAVLLVEKASGKLKGCFTAVPDGRLDIANWLLPNKEVVLLATSFAESAQPAPKVALFAVDPSSLRLTRLRPDLPATSEVMGSFSMANVKGADCSPNGKWFGCDLLDLNPEGTAVVWQVFLVPVGGGKPIACLKGQTLLGLFSGDNPGELRLLGKAWGNPRGHPARWRHQLILTRWPGGRSTRLGEPWEQGPTEPHIVVGHQYAVLAYPLDRSDSRIEIRSTEDNALVASLHLGFQAARLRWVTRDKQVLCLSQKRLAEVTVPDGQIASRSVQGLEGKLMQTAGAVKRGAPLLVATTRALWWLDWENGTAKRFWQPPSRLPESCRQLDPRTGRK